MASSTIHRRVSSSANPAAGRSRRGSSQRRGGAPRQQRHGGAQSRGGSAQRFGPPPRAVSQAAALTLPRPEWDCETRTIGLFDQTLRRPGTVDVPVVRTRISTPGVVSIGAAHATVARVATPRNRQMGVLRRRLEASGMLPTNQIIDMAPPPVVPIASSSASSSVEAADVPSVAAESIMEPSLPPSPHAAQASPTAVAAAPPRQLPVVSMLAAPSQLEVLHVQRTLGNPSNDFAIMLPDGTPLGSGDAMVTASPMRLLALAGPRPPMIPTAEERTEAHDTVQLQALPAPPPGPHARFQSVSQRLSALLGPHETTSERPRRPLAHQNEVATVGRGALAKSYSATVLRSSHATVLREVNALTDAVLQHILADTVSLLGQLPCAAACGTETPAVVRPAHAEHAAARTQATDATLPVDELASRGTREALVELQKLEYSLAWRYTPSCSMGATSLPVAADGHRSEATTSTSLIPARIRVPSPGVLDWAQDAPRKLWPAALPLERIQRIEHYRTRFAHHCLAAREAGIDRSGPGDAASTATWVIWPYLADSITLALVEGVVEECHAEMERHVDELVSRELGTCG